MCDFATGLSRQLYGLTIASERPNHRLMEQWHPLGPIGVITAFNFPVAVWAWNATLAAVCGDTVIWKPSPQTPLTAIAVQKIVNKVMAEHEVSGVFSLCIDEAAEVLLENKLSGAPVVDDKGQVVGIITQIDIFRVIISLTGARKKGIQFGFQLENRPGSIKEVADIIRKYGCRLTSILSSHDDQVDYRHVYIRVCDCDRERIGELKEELKVKANMIYMVDHAGRKKKVYQDYKRPTGSWGGG